MAKRPVIAFDPGATTGFASLDSHGRVLHTSAIPVDDLEEFLEYYLVVEDGIIVLIEKGPAYHSHSPVTRRVEAILCEEFPDAILVQPSQWKSHPASRRKVSAATQHEKDAVRFAHWFQTQGGRSNGKANATGAHAVRMRHQRH